MTWVNSANSHYSDLVWSKTKWHMEELANGEPIPKTRAFGESRDLIVHEMPNLDNFLKSKLAHPVSIDGSTVLRRAGIKVDDRPVVARMKLVDATKEILEETLEAWSKSNNTWNSYGSLRQMLPGMLKRLKWTRIGEAPRRR